MSKSSQILVKSESEARNVAYSIMSKLALGERITGTPTVAEVTTADLTIDNVGFNASEIEHDVDGLVPSAQAIVFRVSGGTSGSSYALRITAQTDANPAQTIKETVTIRVISD